MRRNKDVDYLRRLRMDKETAFVYLENKRIAMNSIVCDTRNISKKGIAEKLFRSSRKVQ